MAVFDACVVWQILQIENEDWSEMWCLGIYPTH